MANQYGFDLGATLNAAEQIKRARIENAFLPQQQAAALQQQQLGNQEATLNVAALPEDIRLRQAGATTSNAAAGLNLQSAQRDFNDVTDTRAAATNIAAKAGATPDEATLVTISPQAADALRKSLQDADDTKRASIEKNVDAIGQAAAAIKSAKDPAQMYLDVKSMLPAPLQAKMPATYDPDYVDHALAQAHEMKTLIGQFDTDTKTLLEDAPSGYRWTDANKTTLVPVAGGPKDPKGNEVKTAQSNAIRSTVIQAFGGAYDPTTGGFSGLDPTQAKRAVKVMADAEQAVLDDGLPIAQAVQKALDAAGGAPAPAGGNAAAPAAAAPGASDSDPLGILQ